MITLHENLEYITDTQRIHRNECATDTERIQNKYRMDTEQIQNGYRTDI